MSTAVRAYLGSIAAVGAATTATFFVQTWIGTSMSILFFPAVVVPAVYLGLGPALLATVLSTFGSAIATTIDGFSCAHKRLRVRCRVYRHRRIGCHARCDAYADARVIVEIDAHA